MHDSLRLARVQANKHVYTLHGTVNYGLVVWLVTTSLYPEGPRERMRRRTPPCSPFPVASE
jgi:hypothetical protein